MTVAMIFKTFPECKVSYNCFLVLKVCSISKSLSKLSFLKKLINSNLSKVCSQNKLMYIL
jgi:hypothetical protein